MHKPTPTLEALTSHKLSGHLRALRFPTTCRRRTAYVDLVMEEDKAGISLPPTPRILLPEVLLLIFEKLPIRCVLRCKVVCKEWHRLISDPLFKSTYNTKNLPVALVLFPRAYTHLPPMSYEMGSMGDSEFVGQPWSLPGGLCPETCTLIGSYNGLVALHEGGSEFHSFYLFNPCTKEEKLVRVPATDEVDEALSFRHDLTGLCHDPTSNEYKLVVAPMDLDPFLVVSFKNGNWKLIKKSPPNIIEGHSNKMCCVKCYLGTTAQGTPHWLGNWMGILCFDGCTEEFRRVDGLPKGGSEFATKPAVACGLGALDGQLTVALDARVKGDKQRREVWVLKEYGNEDSWTLLFVMRVTCSFFSIVSWRKDEWVAFRVEDNLSRVGEPKLRGYDFRLQRSQPLQFGKDILSKYRRSLTYLPTLCSPNT